MIYMGLLQYVNNNGIHDFPLEYLPPNWCQGDKYQMPDQGPILLIFAAVSMAVTAAVVITRFLTRLFVGGRIGWDDWTILAATVVLACHTAVAILGVDVAGIGKHFYDVEFEDLETILKVRRYSAKKTLPRTNLHLTRTQIMFASAMVYSINVFIVKASLLFFYKRLFGAGYPGMQRFINVFIVFLALYAVGSCLGFAFQCNPVHAYWSLQQRTTNCTSLEKSVVIYRTIRAISVTCEVVILILPMRYVFSLTLPLKHRLGLAILFGMGSM